MSDMILATHEAGHALVAHAFDVHVDHVFISAGAGATVLGAPANEQPPALEAAEDDARFPLAEVHGALAALSLVLAGPAAEELVAGESRMVWTDDGCDLDRVEDAELRVAAAVGAVASARLWRSMVWGPTRAFLDRERDALARVAAALVGAGELDAEQLATLAAPLGPPPDLRGALGYARSVWARRGARRARWPRCVAEGGAT